jgi:hypothetical protein
MARFGKEATTYVPKNRECFSRESGDSDIRQAVVIEIAEICSHAGHLCSCIRESHSCIERDLFEAAVPHIVKQKIRNLVVRNKQIRKTVSVVIRYTDGHSFARVFCDSGLDRNILEAAPAQIAIKAVARALEQSWMTVDAYIASLVTAECVKVRSPLNIIDHEEIRKAVIVVVQPCGSNGPFAASDSRLRGHVFECAIASISVKDVALNAGNKQIHPAVVIEVPCGCRDGISGALNARPSRYISKAHFAHIPIQPVPMLDPLLCHRRHLRPICKEDVS